jgi:YesN/AraC family two-component response regulator
MPEFSGLEFIQTVQAKFGNSSPKVILITGFDQYAVSGYDHGVFDYLLKPISFKRFKICIDRLTVSKLQMRIEIIFFLTWMAKKSRLTLTK